MTPSIYIFDPTIKDTQSKVRGIGRYMQILRENFEDKFVFISDIKNFKLKIKNSVFVNPFFNFLQKPLALKRIAKKQIAVIHDLIPLKYPKHFPIGIKGSIYFTLNKLALKNYDVIITDSLASKKDIIDILGLPEKKIKVVYPCLPKIFTNSHPEFISGSDLKQMPKQVRHDNEIPTNYSLYVGDATWNKNLVNLAKAVKKVDLTCVFAGKVFSGSPTRSDENVRVSQLSELGSSEVNPRFSRMNEEQPVSLREKRVDLTRKFSSSESIHPWQKELQEFFLLADNDPHFIFKGFVPDQELISLYQNALFNILPSRDEGFGFSYVEASSQGCPSILSDIPVLREISDNNALFADPQSVDDLAEKINLLKDDVVLRKEISQKAKERSGFFTQGQFKKSIEELLF